MPQVNSTVAGSLGVNSTTTDSFNGRGRRILSATDPIDQPDEILGRAAVVSIR